GTFLPFFRALESPIAIACLRLFTLPPLPPRPLLAVPFLYRRISPSTSLPELLEYLRFLALRAMKYLRLKRFKPPLSGKCSGVFAESRGWSYDLSVPGSAT